MEELKMTDLNSVSLGGRITRDCVVEKTQNGSGVSMVKVSMAVNRSTKKKDSDEYENKAVFIDFTLFGNYAEAMCKHLKKGTYVTVEGFLDMDTWTDSNGKTQQRLKFVPETGKINPWVAAKKENNENAVPPEAFENSANSSGMIY